MSRIRIRKDVMMVVVVERSSCSVNINYDGNKFNSATRGGGDEGDVDADNGQ